MTRHTFHTEDSRYTQHAGQRVTCHGPLDESLFDRAEVGPMYVITLPDGTEAHAFADELDPAPVEATR